VEASEYFLCDLLALCALMCLRFVLQNNGSQTV
jgi:hypothetical protein